MLILLLLIIVLYMSTSQEERAGGPGVLEQDLESYSPLYMNSDQLQSPSQPLPTPIPAPIPVVAAKRTSPKRKKEKKEGCKGTRRNKQGECVPISSDEPVVDAVLPLDQDQEDPVSYHGLYPVVGDPKFNDIITTKKEFYDTRYDRMDKLNIDEYAAKMCDAPDFELAPHQMFVRNFMSVMTPYNSLLLYHGLGTGKTCSAISVAEDMRDYLTQMGLSKRITVVASQNVQDNFRLQLFDERKLRQTDDGLWNLRACTGNKYLNEINPLNMRGLSRETVVSQIRAIINAAYKFVGYIQLGRIIYQTITGQKKQAHPQHQHQPRRKFEQSQSSALDLDALTQPQIHRIQTKFNNALIIIDEVHNLRLTDDNKNEDSKRTASLLFAIAKHAQNLRFLLLSGTPMFNSPKEIVWLLNLMNVNDNRSAIDELDAFLPDGNIRTLTDTDATRSAYSVGKELLKRKSYGYISYVRGENPFTFPYRIYPKIHSPENAMGAYPQTQYDGAIITPRRLNFLDVYVTPIGAVQSELYQICIDRLLGGAGLAADMATDATETETERVITMASSSSSPPPSPSPVADADLADTESENSSIVDETEVSGSNFGFQTRRALQALTMTFPCNVDDARANPGIIFVGEDGLRSVMNERVDARAGTIEFEYKPGVERIFAPANIGKYSNKIASICENIVKCDGGIVLVYSEYIKGGAVPMALALEERGFSRYGGGSQNLLVGSPTAGAAGSGDTYIIVSGNKMLSPNTPVDIAAATAPANRDGSIIRVVIITKAGSEGLDLKNIRQVHIMDPWYNLNLLEQVIGRAVRNCSHRDLEFKYRNVSIFMHGTLLSGNSVEAIDLRLYRYAEDKAVKIGNVSRILKKHAIDCNLNSEYNDLKLKDGASVVQQILSDGRRVEHDVEPKTYSDLCDYQADCDMQCVPSIDMRAVEETDINSDTYDSAFMNTDRVVQRIRDLFKERFFYTAAELFRHINVVRAYPDSQIYAAINTLIDDPIEYISDHYGRPGRLINIGDYYLYQPDDVDNPHIGIRERAMPLDENLEYVEYAQDKTVPVSDTVPVVRVPEFGPTAPAAAPAAPAAAPAAPAAAPAVPAAAAAAAAAPAATSAAKRFDIKQLIGDLQTQYDLATTYHEVLRKETQRAVAAAAAARRDPAPIRDDFNKFSCANKNKLTGATNARDAAAAAAAMSGAFEDDRINDAIIAHYLDVLHFDDALQLVKHLCPHPTRPYNSGDPDVAARRRFEFENRIYKYYQRRIIVSSATGATATKRPDDKYAIILNHDSINEWRGCIDGTACDAADLFDFIVYDKGRVGADNWTMARPSHKEEMVRDIYAHIANLKRGVFGHREEAVGGDDADTAPRYVGFHERTDPKTYKFKTVQIGPDAETGTSKIRGRICANDTDKAANINPMLTTLLRRKLADRGPRAESEIADMIKDKLDSTCVLAELLLRYYDAEAADSADKRSGGMPAPRWYLAPFEMQILIKVMQWFTDRRQKQLKQPR